MDESQSRWMREVYEPAVARQGERRRSFATPSGLEPAPLYGGGEGLPGEPPFLRGVHPTMYRGRLWTMRQYSGFGSPRQTNRRFRELLEAGQTGISVAFDLPTQMGYDSDDPLAAAEVGRVGVPVNTLRDMERLMEGIPLESVTTSMTINATAAVLLAMYVALARRRGVDASRLGGTVQNDILKEYAARGTYRFPPQGSMRLAVDVMEYCVRNLPSFNPISVSGYHMREAGCTAGQEVAFTLANGIAYLEAAAGRGVDVAALGRRVSFFFNAHNHLLEEVAKFRAARRLWARLVRERFGVEDPRALMLRFHAQTAGSTLTSRQPLNNVVRVAMQALAAVLGGTQSLHTNAMDEALGLPSPEAAVLALRTQQILAHETGVADVIDPLGGCPMVEELTDRIEEGARALLARVDAKGGAVAAIAAGWYQEEIHRSALAWQKEVESGERVVVGVNRFQEGDAPVEVFRVDKKAQEEVLEDLRAVRGERDGEEARAALEALQEAARGERGLMEPIVRCVEGMATMGEICAVLEEVFGRHRPGGGGA